VTNATNLKLSEMDDGVILNIDVVSRPFDE
jgi:hypothetical protein